MTKQNLQASGAYLLALLFAIFITNGDLHTDDTQIVVMFLLIFGFILGFAQPQRAWRWVVVLGLPIPIVENIRLVASHQSLNLGNLSGPFLALVFAFIGVYLGVFATHTLRKTQHQ
jgi:hypothetical protein